MRKKRNLLLFVLIAVLLNGCALNLTSMSLEKGLPKGTNADAVTFLKDYISNNTGIELFKKGDSFIYTEVNVRNDQHDIRYYSISNSTINSSYEALSRDKNLNEKFLEEIDRKKIAIKNPESYHLPIISKKQNKLFIESMQNKQTIQLPGLETDKFLINLKQYSKNGSIVEVFNDTSRTHSYIFIPVSLDNIKTIQEAELKNKVTSGDLTSYYGIIKQAGNFLIAPNHNIINPRSNEIYEVKPDDFLSKDGKYVYLDGKAGTIKEGQQRIQTIENYVSDNKEYVKGYKLSFDEIAKKMELKTSGINQASVLYFNDHFVLLYLSYDGVMLGNAGSYNVMVRLNNHEENPQGNIVDLGIIDM